MSPSLKRKDATAALQSGETATIPAWVLDSGKPGPCLLLTAAQHGNEVQGAIAMKRFGEIAAHGIAKGKVIMIPVCNPLAIRDRRPHINMAPEQPYSQDPSYNMNLTWPGDKDGNDSARLSYAICQTFCGEATHAFDLHCWNAATAAALLIRDDPRQRRMAEEIGHRFVVTNAAVQGNNLAGYMFSTGREGMSYEFAGQYLLNEAEIRIGLRVVKNYAKLIGLLRGKPQKGHDRVLFSDQIDKREVKSPCQGLLLADRKKLYAPADKGEALGRLLATETFEEQTVTAPAAGYVYRAGVARPNCDVALPPQHPFVDKDETVALLWSPK